LAFLVNHHRRRLSVPTTAGRRSRGRQGVRSGTSGAVGEHLSKIVATVATALLVLGFTLVMTEAGRDIDAATQRFMLFYAGVFALIGLTASVGVGLLATDRIIMTPGHRVMAQAVHRAVSFGALAFLIIHIVTEILAQRVHVIDAVVPFLSPYRTFYIGLGTIASDLILLIIVTSIFRKRFTAHGKAWRWRAIHYASYLAFVFGVLHGLLGGRSAKPYVDWSYGAAIALTALAVVVRFLAISLRPKGSLSAPPSADRGAGRHGTSPLRAASLSLAQAQLGGTIQALPASMSAQATIGLPGQPRAALPYASGWASTSGPLPALAAAPAYPAETSYEAYPDPALMPLGAPVYAAGPPWPASAGLGPDGRQPRYESGYDGPPRFEGAPRKHVPQDDVSSYPYGAQSRQLPRGPGTGTSPIPRVNTGPMPRLPAGPVPRPGSAPRPRADSGPLPRLGTGPMPRADSGPMPRVHSRPMPRADTGPMPRVHSGPTPRADSGPLPRLGTGPMPRADTGPMPRVHSGPTPRADTGPMPRADTGPMPRVGSGPVPRAETGPMPRVGSGPMPGFGSGPMPRLGTGSVPSPDPGPVPRPDSRPMPRVDTGPMPRVDTGPMPRVGGGPMPGFDSGPMPRLGTAATPQPSTGPLSSPNSGPLPRLEPGPMPHAGNGTHHRGGTRPSRRPSRGTNPYPVAGPMPGADSGLLPRPPARHSRRPDPADPRNRNVPRRTGGTEQG
jgi:DMSO/TMAO reductase YedYZ heme-binding membrane subunit